LILLFCFFLALAVLCAIPIFYVGYYYYNVLPTSVGLYINGHSEMEALGQLIVSNGADYEISSSDDHLVSVTVLSGYDGTMIIRFREPWYYRVSEFASLVTLLTILCLHPICCKFCAKRTVK
jgi:hypothetical protein